MVQRHLNITMVCGSSRATVHKNIYSMFAVLKYGGGEENVGK